MHSNRRTRIHDWYAHNRAHSIFGSHSAVAAVAFVLLAATPVGADVGRVPQTSADQPITFSVTGDAPYGDDEIPEVQQIFDDHNLYSTAEFFVHVGDIFLGGTVCEEYRFKQMADMLKTLVVPAFIIPGDNETKDCSDWVEAWTYWTKHLLGIDQSFCNAPTVSRQSVRPENFAFVRSGVLFMGIHLVGGSNDDDLLLDDADWVGQQLSQNQSSVRAAVIFAQAGPGDSDLFFDQFEFDAQAFGKPILYVHGDGHEWINDFPFNALNVRRVQVDRGNQPPVHVTVTMNPDTLNTFVFERDPWPSGTAYYNNAPCVNAGPDKEISIVQQAYLVGSATDDGLPLNPGNLSHTWSKVSGPGTVSFTSRYQPVTFASFSVTGTYTLRLQVSDGARTAEDRVRVTVIDGPPINDPPEALDDSYSMDINGVLSVPASGVLANDTDANGDQLTAVLSSGVSNGGLLLNADGSFTYTPNTSWFGTETFRYRADDGVFTSEQATVNIVVEPVTLSFGATDDAYVLSSDPMDNFGDSSSLRIDEDDETYRSYLKFNVSGTGANIYSARIRLYATNGSDDGGSLYRVSNSFPGSSAAWDEDSLVWENAPPLAGTPLSTLGSFSKNVWVEIDVTSAVVGDGVYSFGIRSNSDDAARFSSKEGDDSPQLVIVTVPGGGNVNDTPLARNDSYSVAEDETLTRVAPGVRGNDSDANGDPLTVTMENGTSNGSVVLQPDGAFTYTPNANYNGTDSFSYVADDNRGGQDAGLVTLMVTAVNDAPVGSAESYTTDEDLPLTVPAPGVLANDTDLDGDGLTATVVGEPVLGSLDLSTDGSFTYTPNANANGADSFTYRVRDGKGGTDDVTVTIDVVAVEDAPVARDDSYTTSEDSPLSVAAPGLLGNDHDAENDSMVVSLGVTTQNGTLALAADGSFTYTPTADYNGTDTFTYTVTDANGGSDVGRATLEVSAVNDAPEGSDDSFATLEDTPIAISAPGVLANDSDLDGDPITAVVVTPPPRGVLALSADGSFTYTPQPDDHGRVPFTYRVEDGAGASDTVSVALDVTPVEDPPVATDDGFVVDEDVVLTVNAPGVLGNDTDADGDELSVAIDVAPGNGTLSLSADGAFSYTPDANFNGTDSFTYTVSDGSGRSDTGRATIAVTAVNDDPVGVDDGYSTNEDVPLVVGAPGVLQNDADVDGNALSALVAEPPVRGTLVLNTDGSIRYTPNLNEYGADTFTYTVVDGEGGSDTRTVTLDIVPVNDTPAGADDAYATNEDEVLVVDAPGVLENDLDVDGDPLTVMVETTPTAGTLGLSANGAFTYEPAADANGLDEFTYTVHDGNGGSDTRRVTLSVSAVNDAPVGVNDSYATTEDTELVVPAPGVLTNDADVDGDPLSVNVASAPPHGTLQLNSDGSFSYRPQADYNGLDSFTYNVDDGAGGTDVRTVWVAIGVVNDPPQAAADEFAATEDTPLAIAAPGVVGNDTDVDGDGLSVSLETSPTFGTISLASDGSFVYTPNPDAHGDDRFTYTVTDGNGGFDTGNVTLPVAPVQDAPRPNSDAFALAEDGVFTLTAPGVLANDVEVDGEALSATLVLAPAQGTVSLDPSGAFTYTPQPDFNGTDSFTYAAEDGSGGSENATVSLSVMAVNDIPMAAADAFVTLEDQAAVVAAPGVLSNDVDVDGDALSVSLIAPPSFGNVSLDSDGSFIYTPDANYNGADSFSYAVSDPQGTEDVGAVALTIEAQNDPPSLVSDVYSTDEDATLEVDDPGVLSNDSDVDGDALSATVESGPNRGTLDLRGDGSFTYTPAPDFNGSDAFTYRVVDGNGGSRIGDVELLVRAVNDTPISYGEAFATSEDVPLNVPPPGVLANDTDIDGDALSVELLTGTSNGNLALASDGSFTYTPDHDFYGTDSFTYRTLDGTSASNSSTVTISVSPVNDAPLAAADSYSLDEDESLVVARPGVLGNDSDVEGSVLGATLETSTTHGELVFNSDGSFSYTPHADFNGQDSFAYTSHDGSGGSATASVTLFVAPVNDAPMAMEDAYDIDEDATLNVAAPGVLNNDTDVENDDLTATLLGAPSNGTLHLAPDGSFTYVPAADFFGEDTFTYAVADGNGGSNTGRVSIVVRALNDVPTVVAAERATDEDVTLRVEAPGLLRNATDADGDVLRATLRTPPTHGTAIVEATGAFTYDPDPDVNGSDTFTYAVEDGNGGSATATMTLTINPVQDPPRAQPDTYSTPEDVPLVIAAPGVIANDVDVDGDPLRVSLEEPPANGSLDLDGDGAFRYTPDADFNGGDSFTYALSDGSGSSDLGTVSLVVTAQNDAPLAVDDQYALDEDATLVVAAPGVLGNDSDVDGDALGATMAVPPSYGTLVLNPDGSFEYTPRANFNGDDAFAYAVDDGNGGVQTGSVRLSVRAVNDAPVAALDDYAVDEDDVLRVTAPGVLQNDSDVDADDMVAALESEAANGSVSLASDGSFVYTPSPNFHGIDEFTYSVRDARGARDSAAVTITVRSVNDAPILRDDTFEVIEDVVLVVDAPGVLTNDSDPDADVLVAEIEAAPQHGTLLLQADGAFVYTPAPDFSGSDSFRYVARDGDGSGGSGLVSLTIAAVNDAPVPRDDAYTLMEDTTLQVEVPGMLGNDSDVDGDALQVALETGPAHGTLQLQVDGGFAYVPNANFFGRDSFGYIAIDAAGGTAMATVHLEVQPVNDTPVALADSFQVRGGAALNLAAMDLLGNDGDVDGDSLFVEIVTAPRYGILTPLEDGGVEYAPFEGFTGLDVFWYRASDGHERSAEVPVRVSVEGRGVTYRGSVAGSASDASEVTSLDIVPADSDRLYLLAVSSKPFRRVDRITGLQLDWTLVRRQCANAGEAGIEVWMARGTGVPGPVTAHLEAVVDHAVMSVTQYSGVDRSDPLGTIVSANASGSNDDCASGAGSGSYAIDIQTLTEGGVVYGAVTMRDREHTPEHGFIERWQASRGEGPNAVSIAILDRAVDAATHTLGGRFDGDVGWAAVSLEIRSNVVPDDRSRFTNALGARPNPFNAGLSLEFTLHRRSRVTLRVYDAAGRIVRHLLDDIQPPGRITRRWDARDDSGRTVGSGVYFVRMDVEGHRLVRKVILLK